MERSIRFRLNVGHRIYRVKGRRRLVCDGIIAALNMVVILVTQFFFLQGSGFISSIQQIFVNFRIFLFFRIFTFLLYFFNLSVKFRIFTVSHYFLNLSVNFRIFSSIQYSRLKNCIEFGFGYILPNTEEWITLNSF